MMNQIVKLGIALTIFWSGFSYAQNATPTEVVIEVCQDGINGPQAYCEINTSPGSNSSQAWCDPVTAVNVSPTKYECRMDQHYKQQGTCDTAPVIGYKVLAYCNFTLQTEYQCLDPDYPLPEYDPASGIVVSCHATECNGEGISSGEPSPEDIAFYNAYGYVCGPQDGGGCQMTHIGSSGSTHYWVESNNLMCPETGAGSASDSSQDGNPFDSPPSGDEPQANGDCGNASVWDQFCNGDPSSNCHMSNGLQVCDEGCGYFGESFICQNDDYTGPNPFGPQPDPPDGDLNGDGKVNIDLGPTNSLLQQIRNNTAKTAADGTQGIIDAINAKELSGGGATDSEGDPINYTDLLTQIKEKLTGDETAANDAISGSTADGETAITADQENSEDLFGKEGNTFITVTSDDTEFHSQLESKTSSIGGSIGSAFSAGGSCPALSFDTSFFSEDIDVQKVADVVRPFMTFVIWFMVAMQGYYIFFKWGLS